MGIELDPLALLSEKAIYDSPKSEAFQKRERLRLRREIITLCGEIVVEKEDPDRSTDEEKVSLPVPIYIGGSPFEQRVKVKSVRDDVEGDYVRFFRIWELYIERPDGRDQRSLISITQRASYYAGKEERKSTVLRNHKGGVATNPQLREGVDALNSFVRQLRAASSQKVRL